MYYLKRYKRVEMNKVSDFVGQHFRNVKKSGDNFITNCPFHDDKTPSLSIHQQNGYFLCFSCGEKGSFHKLRSKMGDTSVSYNNDTTTSKTPRKSRKSTFSKEKNLKKDKKKTVRNHHFLRATGVLTVPKFTPRSEMFPVLFSDFFR